MTCSHRSYVEGMVQASLGESNLAELLKAMVDHLAHKLAESHVFGPRSDRATFSGSPRRVKVARPLGMQCQLLARALGRGVTHGQASAALLEAVLTQVALQDGRGLAPWQAAFVRSIEAEVLVLGCRRSSSGRVRRATALVIDLRRVAQSIPGAPRALASTGKDRQLRQRLGRQAVTLAAASRSSLTPMGLARVYCEAVGVPFPRQPRRRATSRRVGARAQLPLPCPMGVSSLQLTEPQPWPATRVPGRPVELTTGVPVAMAELVDTLALPIHTTVVTNTLTDPFVADIERRVLPNEVPTVINALVRLMAVGYFTEASSAHVALAQAIVGQARAGASSLDVERATFLHLVGWLFDGQRTTEDAVRRVQDAIPHLVIPSDRTLLPWMSLPAHGLVHLRKLRAPFAIAREWAAQCAIGWPQHLQPSRGARRRRGPH